MLICSEKHNKPDLDNLKWQPDNSLSRSFLPSTLMPWLTDQGSLTAALTALSNGTFEVTVLSQKLAVPLISEQSKLGRQHHLISLVREVNLCINNEPVVYARSVIPLSLSGRGAGGLATLGQTPLGHLLFKNGRMRISRRDFAKTSLAAKPIYARRTPYDYLGKQLLVSEFFLPALHNYI